MGLRWQKAGQKWGQMIPLLQLVLGHHGFAALPADAVVEADAFAALMAQPALPTEGAEDAAILAVMAMIPQFVPPQPGRPDLAPQPGMSAGVTDSPQAEKLLTSGTTPTSPPMPAPTPSPMPTPVPADLDAALDPVLAPRPEHMPMAPTPLRTATVLSQPLAQFGGDFSGKVTTNQVLVAKATSKTTPRVAGEAVFFARVEADASALTAAAPQSGAAQPAAAQAVAAPPVTPQAAAVPRDLSATADPAVPKQKPADPVAALAAGILSRPADIPRAVDLDQPDLDPMETTKSELQLPSAPRPDRLPIVISAGVSMPASVPATLIVHAPEAAFGPVEVVLNPEELGKVRFEIHQQGDQVKVVLVVERPETLELLRRHADQLAQEFRAAGFAGASFSFGQWTGQPGKTPGDVDDSDSDTPGGDPSHPPPPAVIPRNFVATQGLNLRL